MEEDNLESVKRGYEQSQRKLLRAYFSQIEKRFDKTNEQERVKIIKNLECFVESDFVGMRPVFDPEHAKKLRMDTCLTQRELAKKLGTHSQSLSAY